ncbi:hypothetical protein ACFFSW_28450 [Saccharothrix longispora]|uniref:Polyketide cyclase/dehydrase/lipid transport protein n=1 Tax=Saccharothrix longispora TaxID=33920 RepID=A0ABU1Q187_9PSEU|nr:hypothetical protein [Saccharothrix longispora]MDR6596665.1 hypothetical protein [Saccharothrix longispora]
MTSYEYRAPVGMAAQEFFGFLARPGSLSQHLPGLSGTTPGVDRDRRVVTWDENGYRGELTVVEDGAGQSEIVIVVETDQGGDVRKELAEAVAAVSHRATAEAESSATAEENSWY